MVQDIGVYCGEYIGVGITFVALRFHQIADAEHVGQEMPLGTVRLVGCLS